MSIIDGKVQLLKSNDVVENAAKLPTTDQLILGELAINYHDGVETISTKNDNNEIVTFSSDDQIKFWIQQSASTVSGGTVTEIDPIFRASAAFGISASDITNWNGKTSNVGTITGINMNGSSKGTSGVVDLGTVLTGETDPTVPSWAKESTKPSYTASEVGALSTGATLDNVADGSTRKLSNYATQANFTAHTGNAAIHFTTGDVKTQIESYNYITGYTETDPTVPSWAKETNKPSYTASEVGALSTGATLDNVSDGSTRKLSDYATNANFTAHTASTTVHVSTNEKSTWNGKQDSISDLTTIRNNASSGASAYNNMLTGVTVNGASASVTNKVAAITVPNELPSYSASDSGKVLSVNSSGQLVWITPVSIYSGSGAPDQSLGNNGDIYLQTS